MDTNVSDFMDALSQCCDRENYLSDVTYALCESNQKFMKFFLDFFFKDKDIDANQVSISREYRFEDSRPDFLIEKLDPHEFFIVEVKINDRNHHFKQYKDTLEKLHKEASKGGKYQPKDFKQHIGYIGIYLVEDKAQCVVEFKDRAGWGGLVCREFKRNCQDLEKTRGHTIEYSVEDQCLYFYMNAAEHGFTESNFRRFFDNVIQYVRGDENSFVQEKQNLVECNQWLAMSRLPTLIKSELFRGWSDSHDGYDVALVEVGMGTYDYARNISSLCVEWFKMSFTQEDKGRREFWGFVGMVWDTCSWISGEKVLRRLKGGPKFVVCVTSGLGKTGKEQAQKHGWIEQPSDGSWVKIFNDADLKLGIENLQRKFQSTLKAILPIRQS